MGTVSDHRKELSGFLIVLGILVITIAISLLVKKDVSRSLLKFSGGHSSFRLLPDRTLRV